MEVIYAALLLHKTGKDIDEQNLKKIIEAAGATPDEARIKSVVTSLKGVDIEKTLKEAAALPAAAPTEEKAKAEEKKVEERKEEAAEGLAALFG